MTERTGSLNWALCESKLMAANTGIASGFIARRRGARWGGSRRRSHSAIRRGPACVNINPGPRGRPSNVGHRAHYRDGRCRLGVAGVAHGEVVALGSLGRSRAASSGDRLPVLRRPLTLPNERQRVGTTWMLPGSGRRFDSAGGLAVTEVGAGHSHNSWPAAARGDPARSRPKSPSAPTPVGGPRIGCVCPKGRTSNGTAQPCRHYRFRGARLDERPRGLTPAAHRATHIREKRLGASPRDCAAKAASPRHPELTASPRVAIATIPFRRLFGTCFARCSARAADPEADVAELVR